MNATGRRVALAAILAAAALLVRASRAGNDLPRPSRVEAVLPPAPAEQAPSEPEIEESPDPAIAEFVELLKAGSGNLEEMLTGLPMAEVLRRLVRQAPLEHGFAALRQLVSEQTRWRESVLHVLAARDVDEESRLFALRLLPPFAGLTDVERSALDRLLDPPPAGELGRQLVRYVREAVPWLSRLLERSEDLSVKAEALRALARCPDPAAESIVRRWFEDPGAPSPLKAALLSAWTASGAVSRHPWLPDALESLIMLRPGDPMALQAVTILGQAGDHERLSRLISATPERALTAFALRWLPAEEAAATLASMAANPAELLRVRLIAVESLRGRTSPAAARQLRLLALEPGLPDDLKAALEMIPRE